MRSAAGGVTGGRSAAGVVRSAAGGVTVGRSAAGGVTDGRSAADAVTVVPLICSAAGGVRYLLLVYSPVLVTVIVPVAVLDH